MVIQSSRDRDLSGSYLAVWSSQNSNGDTARKTGSAQIRLTEKHFVTDHASVAGSGNSIERPRRHMVPQAQVVESQAVAKCPSPPSASCPPFPPGHILKSLDLFLGQGKIALGWDSWRAPYNSRHFFQSLSTLVDYSNIPSVYLSYLSPSAVKYIHVIVRCFLGFPPPVREFPFVFLLRPNVLPLIGCIPIVWWCHHLFTFTA